MAGRYGVPDGKDATKAETSVSVSEFEKLRLEIEKTKKEIDRALEDMTNVIVRMDGLIKEALRSFEEKVEKSFEESKGERR